MDDAEAPKTLVLVSKPDHLGHLVDFSACLSALYDWYDSKTKKGLFLSSLIVPEYIAPGPQSAVYGHCVQWAKELDIPIQHPVLNLLMEGTYSAAVSQLTRRVMGVGDLFLFVSNGPDEWKQSPMSALPEEGVHLEFVWRTDLRQPEPSRAEGSWWLNGGNPKAQ